MLGLALPLPGPGLDEKATQAFNGQEITPAKVMYSLVIGLGYSQREAARATERAGYSLQNAGVKIWGCAHRSEIERAVTCLSARKTKSGIKYGVMLFFEKPDRSLRLVKEKGIEAGH